LEPIGNNELARLAGVGSATALRFFEKWFKGYAKYRSICMRDVSKLIDTIKAMRGEFIPSNEPNYGAAPPAECERDD
jgi:DNA-binding MurR/RpiR family transcriptional regulator